MAGDGNSDNQVSGRGPRRRGHFVTVFLFPVAVVISVGLWHLGLWVGRVDVPADTGIEVTTLAPLGAASATE